MRGGQVLIRPVEQLGCALRNNRSLRSGRSAHLTGLSTQARQRKHGAAGKDAVDESRANRDQPEERTGYGKKDSIETLATIAETTVNTGCGELQGRASRPQSPTNSPDEAKVIRIEPQRLTAPRLRLFVLSPEPVCKRQAYVHQRRCGIHPQGGSLLLKRFFKSSETIQQRSIFKICVQRAWIEP